jgi:hypothetical protein
VTPLLGRVTLFGSRVTLFGSRVTLLVTLHVTLRPHNRRMHHNYAEVQI